MRRRLAKLGLFLAIGVVASTVVAWGGCEKKASDPASSTPATPEPPAATAKASVIDEYRALWERVDRSGTILVMHLYPNRPGLELAKEAPTGEHGRLVAWLRESQPVVERLLELTKKSIEPFPPSLSPTPQDPDAHMRHPSAWCHNFGRLLNADAGRCWEKNDAHGAARRLAALMRLSQRLAEQPAMEDQVTGVRLISAAVGKTLAMSKAGLIKRLSAERFAELRAAVDETALPDLPSPYEAFTKQVAPDLDLLRRQMREKR